MSVSKGKSLKSYRSPGQGKTAPHTARKLHTRKPAKTADIKKMHPSPPDSNHRYTSMNDGDAERTSISPTTNNRDHFAHTSTTEDFEMTQSSIF